MSLVEQKGTNISIVKGTTNAFAVYIENEDGTPFEMNFSSQSLVFAVKKHPKDNQSLFTKKLTYYVEYSEGTGYSPGMNGAYVLNIDRDDTKDLPPGKYFYDIGLKSYSRFFNIIEASVFEIRPNISKYEDGE